MPIFVFFLALFLGLAAPGYSSEKLPDTLYPDLEYLLSIPNSTQDLDLEKLNQVVNFVACTPAETSMTMASRDKATGGFHAFVLQGTLERVLDYAYNPDIPVYVTMPSSVREQEWLTAGMHEQLLTLPQGLYADEPVLVRGSEREIITPDANTGGYYAYEQDRALLVFQGSTGPVLISIGCQPEPSDVGRKGVVVGDDNNWNYLYSQETGLTKTGLGWVDSYMYNAHSILVFVADTAANEVRVGSFKWLHAGWAGMNMVKSTHIINGIKRFSTDFVTVLEAPQLPTSQDLADMYRQFKAQSRESLQARVAPYFEALDQCGASAIKTAPFKALLASGQYLENMSQAELVKVLVQEYIKNHVGRETFLQVAQITKMDAAQP